MPSVILLSPQNVETTVTTAVEFNEYVFGYGFRPKTGTIEANFAALLVGGVAPNPDPNAVVRLGDLSAAGSAARVALGAALVLPTVGSYTYNSDGTVASAPDGSTYSYNTDGTVKTKTLAGVTRTYSYDTAGNVASVA